MLINEAVLHILDKNSGNLLLSQAPLQLGDPFLIEYITKLVDKIKKGDPHIGQLAADEPLLGYLADEGISFLEKTQQLADKLFALIPTGHRASCARPTWHRAGWGCPSVQNRRLRRLGWRVGSLRAGRCRKYTGFRCGHRD